MTLNLATGSFSHPGTKPEGFSWQLPDMLNGRHSHEESFAALGTIPLQETDRPERLAVCPADAGGSPRPREQKMSSKSFSFKDPSS